MNSLPINRNSKWIIFLAFAAIYIVWGSTYLAILIGLKGLPPLLLCSFRFLFAGPLLLGWCLWRGEKLPSVQSVRINTICGILLLCGGVGSVSWAEQYLPSSFAAIIVAALPFWFILLDKKQWSFYFSNKFIILGLVLGFAGVVLLVGFDQTLHSTVGKTGKEIIGCLVILAGGICWASGSLFSKYKKTGSSVLMNGAMQLIIAGLFSLLLSGLAGEWNNFQFRQVSAEAWLALLYLIIMGSIITYLSYLFLLKIRPAAQVSTYVYVNPLVALLLGVLIANEQVTRIKLIALLVILSGVLMVNIPAYKTVSKNKS